MLIRLTHTSMPAIPLPSVESKARLFRGFAEPSRLLILEALRDGEKTVSDICQATGLTQPNASNHLACLLGCRLVDREQRGRFAFYRLADGRIDALLSLGEEMTSGTGAGPACCPVCGSESW
jgi:DNA-binding transcriptional ArsR family regulator